jgi:hypothetical protein
MRASPAGPALAQLALLEGRRLAAHPVFLAGLALAAGGCAAFVARDTSGRAGWEASGWTVYAGFALMAPFTMVATNVVTLRDRRADAVEQHEALPMPVSTRVGAVLTPILAPTLLAAAGLAAVTAYAASRFDLDPVDLLVLGSLPLTMTALAALGVALARWLPSPFVAPALALAFYFWTPGDESSAWQTLMPLNSAENSASAAMRLPYLLGLTFLFAGAALAQPRRSRTSVLLAAAGAVLVTTSAMVILT